MWERTDNFIRARDAWASARGRGAGAASAKLAARRAYWAARVDVGKSGPPKSITAWMARREATLEPFIAGIQRAIPEALAEAFDDGVSRLLFAAWNKWPVDTGVSKSSLTVTYGQRGDDYVAKIEDTAPYVFYIKGNPWSRLIVGPGRVVAQEIQLAALKELIGRTS